jgi:hypothetical protein
MVRLWVHCKGSQQKLLTDWVCLVRKSKKSRVTFIDCPGKVKCRRKRCTVENIRSSVLGSVILKMLIRYPSIC